MRILQLGKGYPPVNLGGVEVTIKLITEGLNNYADEIICDSLGVNDKFIYEEEKIFDYTIYRSKGLGKYFSTLLSLQLITKLRQIQNNYDIIHIHSPDPMSGLALFLTRPNCKIVLHWHSDIIKQRILLKGYAPILNWLLKRANLIIATSPNYAEGSYWLRKYKDRVRILPIGIKEGVMEPSNDVIEEIKSKSNRKKIVFSLGRLAYYKGYDDLISAAKYLNDDYVIVIAGEGPFENELRNQIENSKLKAKVFLVGSVTEEEKSAYFSLCNVFCLTSKYKTEAFGIVQIEAMKHARPLVSTKIEGSGVHWVNQNNETGVTVNIDSPKEIADAILKINESEGIYNNFCFNSRQRFDKFFTDKIMIKKLVGYYSEILRKD